MSAPDTDTKKQAKRHRPALFGIGSSILFALLLLLGLIVFLFLGREGPGDAADDPATVEGTDAATGGEAGGDAAGEMGGDAAGETGGDGGQ